MTIKEFDTQGQLDDDFEKMEEINQEHYDMKLEIERAREENEEAEYEVERITSVLAEANDFVKETKDDIEKLEQKLITFEEKNKEYLI